MQTAAGPHAGAGSGDVAGNVANITAMAARAARLVSSLIQTRAYRPTFTLPAFVPASQCQRGRWKTYAPATHWSKEKCADMYAELRAFVQRRYVSPQQLTGFEAFRHTQVLFGHFAVTQILLHDQQRFHATAARPHPPMPRVLRQAFQLMAKSRAKTRDGSGAPVRFRGRSAFRHTALYRDGKPIFVQARSRRIRLGPPAADVADGANGAGTKRPCVSRCSIADIRCSKYIIHHGLGVDLATRLPNGQTVAAFATQYIYNEHVRRLTRKRLRPAAAVVAVVAAGPLPPVPPAPPAPPALPAPPAPLITSRPPATDRKRPRLATHAAARTSQTKKTS